MGSKNILPPVTHDNKHSQIKTDQITITITTTVTTTITITILLLVILLLLLYYYYYYYYSMYGRETGRIRPRQGPDGDWEASTYHLSSTG